jgi:RNA polymerase sigma-70 factor (ECF subfamily)
LHLLFRAAAPVAQKKMQPAGTAARLCPDGKAAMTANADASAVDRVLAGDTAAFAAIVQRWQGPLVKLAYRFCRNHARAEDMAQEAFLRAFGRLATWRRESVFSSWLFALATNLYRSEIRHVPMETLPFDDIPEVAGPRQVERDFEEQDRRMAVRRALNSLPRTYRETLQLFYFHEMDVAAAARSLGLPQGTVKARLSRGRDLLRRKLTAILETREPKRVDEHG